MVLNAQTITLGDDIEVSGKGFRRGELGVGISYTNCFENSYVLPASNGNSVFKGESIATVSQNMVKGKASLASGGGAGLSVKSGGGGGANAGTGGFGGYQSDTCGSAPYDNRGMGGRSLAYSTLANKTDGTLWSWGNNTNGQLGLGNTTFRSSPVQIGALTTWVSIAACGQHTLAISN